MKQGQGKIRILHVIGRLQTGGVEVWLLNLLRTMDKDKFKFDFVVQALEPGNLETEAIALGAKIWRCPVGVNPFSYARKLKAIWQQAEPYQVIHSHVHHFSGWILLLAYLQGIPVRIAHSHTDMTAVDAGAFLSRQAYLAMMKWSINLFATIGLAASASAAQTLQTPCCRRLTWKTVVCGIDLAPYGELQDKELLRQQRGIPAKALVLGHVGNFTPAKNQGFLLQVFKECLTINADSYLVLAGDGPLIAEGKAQAHKLGLDERILFLGTCANIPLILGLMDVFVFPSLFEGLGLAVIEAQAAGLPVILSDVVPQEVDMVPGQICRLSLTRSAAEWAQACLQAYASRGEISHQSAWKIINQSAFNIQNNVQEIEAIYLQAENGSCQ